MNIYNEMLERAKLQHIRGFIQCEGADLDIANLSYHERIKLGERRILERLKALIPDAMDYDNAESELNTAFGAYGDVYMEIGMKVGARLIMELLLKDDD